jgi:hypothetical protein
MTTRAEQSTQSKLVTIPLIEAPDGPLQLARMQSDALLPILAIAHEILPRRLLGWADRLSQSWLRRSVSPYRGEIDAVARLMPERGAYALNLNFEWACTTGCHRPSGSDGMTLYRTLDWPLRLGGAVVVAQHQTGHGAYLNITWPGFIGVLTAMAPQRFAAAINQGPMAYSFGRIGAGMLIDWFINRLRLSHQRALPPTHLLRQVFETCDSYAEAKQMLLETPVCAPVLFTLTGTHPDEGCIIERRENDGIVHDGSGAVANHWLTQRYHGRPRPIRSHDRQRKLLDLLPSLKGGLDWVQPPILNMLTRLACEMNAMDGTLVVQGRHGADLETEILTYEPPKTGHAA